MTRQALRPATPAAMGKISLAGLGNRARREINRRTTMTRSQHEEIETLAIAAMIGLISSNAHAPGEVAAKAFDHAEAFREEKLKRIGEQPPFGE
jgi:hypothetical protein